MRNSILIILLLSVFNGFSAEKPVLLVKDGKSSYRIVISATASEQERFAAEMLQSYLLKISGATLPVVSDSVAKESREIAVGFSNRTTGASFDMFKRELSPDGFRILVQGKQVFLLGGTHKGSVYAVVDLLEKQLGCRKYSPNTEYIPSSPTIQLDPMDITDQPVATFRSINGHFTSDPYYKAWQRLDDYDDIFAKGYYVHTMGRLVPWENYYSSHPEYFAFMNGKRITDQPCLSHPEVFKITIEQLRKDMQAQPGMEYWSVSQNDNFSYCQCPECKKAIEEEGSAAGPVIRFVNKVAEQFPDKMISTLAYQYSRQAPKITKPLDNVQIMLCTIELNRSKSIESDPSSRQFLQDIVDWGKISKHIYLWDYTVNFSHHISPFPNLHVLQPNIQFFIRNGALDHFQQSNTDAGHEFSELKCYLISRLLWNPGINADSVMDQFLRGYYGDAAPNIREYIDLLEEEYIRSGQVLDIYGSPVWNAGTSLSADNMSVYNYLFDNAEKAVAGDKEYLKHVKVARLPVQFAAMEIGKNDMFGPRGWYIDVNGKFLLRPKMKAMLESFYSTCKANQVRTLTESGLSPEEYYKSTLRFIDVRIENNLAFRKKITASPSPSPKYSYGEMAMLTNGVQGANDYKVHWLGWENMDFQLNLDLEKPVSPKKVSLGTLYDPKSWILHPVSVRCEVSPDGLSWKESGTLVVEGDQRKEEVNRTFVFEKNLENIRYIRFNVTGTHHLPIWHPSAGGDSWVFVDEIVVE